MNRGVNRALLLGMVWIALEYVALGPYSYFKIRDNGDSIVPALLSQTNWLLDQQFWFPYAGAGADRLALGFYAGLDTLLFGLVPGWLAYQIFVLSQLACATIFTYALARRVLGLGEVFAAIAGFAYALSTLSGQLPFSAMSFLPLVIWSLARAMDAADALRRWSTVLAIGAFYGLTAHAQLLLPFPFVVILLWFWVLEGRRGLGETFLIVAFYTVCLSLRAQDVLAMAANGELSHRPEWSAEFDPRSALRRALAHFDWSYWNNHGGGEGMLIAKATLVIFLIGGAFRTVRTSTYARLLAIGILLLLAPAATELVAYLLLDWLPFLTKYSYLRFHFYLYFITALGAAYVLATLPDYFVGSKRRAERSRRQVSDKSITLATVLGILLTQSLIVKVGHAIQWFEKGNYVSAFESPLIHEIASRNSPDQAPFRVTSFRSPPNFMHRYGLETVDGYLTIYPQRYFEFWEKVIKKYADNHEIVKMQLEQSGRRFYLFNLEAQSPVTFRDHYDLNLLSLANMRYIFSKDALLDDDLTVLARPRHSWSDLSPARRRAVRKAANFEGWTEWFLYENRKVFPRYFLVSRIEERATAKEVLDAFARAPLGRLRDTAFVERGRLALPDEATLGFSDASIRILDRTPDRIGLSVSSDGWSILIVTNAYTPYWRCTIDGRPQPIFPADHAFWGVVVGPGDHEVVFSYQPPQRLFLGR